jgi:hypothetical protein
MSSADPATAGYMAANRVLVPPIPVGCSFQDETGGEWTAWNYSFVPFLMEEFIALGVMDVVLSSGEEPDYLRSIIVPELRPRLLVERCEAGVDSARILAPIAEEFGYEFDAGAAVLKRANGESLAEGPVGEIFSVACALEKLLIGIKYEAEISLNLARVKQDLVSLANVCRSGRSRATIAVLRGILNAYAPVQTDAVIIRPSTTDRQIRLFLTFVEDSTYREMSQAAHAFGIPGRLERSRQLFSRAARALILKAPFRQTVNLGSKIISAATHVPIPDADVAASLFHKEYLPAVVDVDDAVARAIEQWKRVAPTAAPPQSLGRKLRRFQRGTGADERS